MLLLLSIHWQSVCFFVILLVVLINKGDIMKKIELTGKYDKGKYALVDDEDYEVIGKWKWHLSKDGYVKRTYKAGSKVKAQLLHRAILANGSNKKHIDHINHDKLDNQKHNLRWASPSENGGNSKLSKSNTTGYKGVTKRHGKFRSHIRHNRVLIHIGVFDTPEEAAKAYDKKAREMFGEYAWLNFPDRI